MRFRFGAIAIALLLVLSPPGCGKKKVAVSRHTARDDDHVEQRRQRGGHDHDGRRPRRTRRRAADRPRARAGKKYAADEGLRAASSLGAKFSAAVQAATGKGDTADASRRKSTCSSSSPRRARRTSVPTSRRSPTHSRPQPRRCRRRTSHRGRRRPQSSWQSFKQPASRSARPRCRQPRSTWRPGARRTAAASRPRARRSQERRLRAWFRSGGTRLCRVFQTCALEANGVCVGCCEPPAGSTVIATFAPRATGRVSFTTCPPGNSPAGAATPSSITHAS